MSSPQIPPPAVPYPGEALRVWAQAQPDALAVTDGVARLSYADAAALADHVEGLVAALPAHAPVGIDATRSVEAVCAMVGIVASGRPYVPFDPEWPVARAELVARTVGVTAIIAPGSPIGPSVRRLDERPPAAWPTDPGAAYVLPTSGSSGQPKGVEVSVRALTAMASAFIAEFGLGPDDVVLHCAPLTFDVSAWEVFVPLMAGAAVCVADAATVQSPGRLTRLMRDEGVTVLDVLPSLLDALVPAELPAVRIAMTGIEPVPAAVVDRWATADRPVYNGYGPTEATVIATLMRCVPGAGDPPIGFPLPSVEAVVVDLETRDPAPRGELWLGGAQLATRYVGAAAEQERAFVERTFPDRDARRWYRTGDLVAEEDDGALSYLGRIDHQVKLGGRRVSLLDVEAGARSHAGVGACAAVVADGPSGPRVALALVPRPGRRGHALIATLGDHLATVLPPYMVPDEIVLLERLPVLANGKVDRAAVAAAVGVAPRPAPAFPAPVDDEDPIRRAVAAVLTDVLAGAVIAPELPPLESLAAIRVAGRLRQALGVDVTAPQVLKARTIDELVAACEDDDDVG